jgi:outer membrane cobalamin receptor
MGLKQGFRIGAVSGYFDVAGFYQRYKNTIEYLFGVWDRTVAPMGFKFLNTGESRVRGMDFSLALSTSGVNKKFGITALVGYTYVEPVSLTPDSVYAHSESFGGGPGIDLSYKTASLDTTDNILKYRFKHMIKGDLELKIYRFNIGFSYRYYSRMQNIDKAFQDLESLTYNANIYFHEIRATQYWKTHWGTEVIDCRLGYHVNDHHKISIVVSNLFNTAYTLRPMKIEAPRTTSLQYMFSF